tara:strand:+ start:1274 stop:2632 length:1359 start_codon:yes stop_codon:yes gene_type:complete
MAEIRFNYGDKFTQTTDTNTGIGSATPEAKLDVAGGTSAGSLRVSGIATLSSYQGFVNTKLTTNTDDLIVEAGQSGSVSGEVVIGTGQTISVSTGATTGQGGVQSLKVYETFMPPVGGTADRPTDVKPGMVYYNKDFKTIEFWDGNFWKQVDNTTRSGRAIFAAGNSSDNPDGTSSIEFVQTSSQGNGISFGDLTRSAFQVSGSGSNTRGIFGGGDPGPSSVDVIDYITIASSGDAIDFGNLSAAGRCSAGASSQTRSLFLGVNSTNVIDFIEIQTLGNAVDFGDIANGQSGSKGYAASSPTRYIYYSALVAGSTIQFGTIASKGDTTTFGETNGAFKRKNCASNSIRAIFAGGYIQNPTTIQYDNIDFITISSEGNAVDFGNLREARSRIDMTGNERTCLMAGGQPGSSAVSFIESVNYSSNGTVEFFGDLTIARNQGSATSDSHGGLGGF